MPDRIPYIGDDHRDIFQREAKAERDRFYRGERWKRLRLWFLSKHPLCARCAADDRDTEATTVHHKAERLTLPKAEWYKVDNLEALCSGCHSAHHNKHRNHG